MSKGTRRRQKEKKRKMKELSIVPNKSNKKGEDDMIFDNIKNIFAKDNKNPKVEAKEDVKTEVKVEVKTEVQKTSVPTSDTTTSKTSTTPKISTVSKFGTYASKYLKPCHEITEIYPNLYLCGISQVKELIQKKKVQVLFPLDHVSGDIWAWGFKGDLRYYPIPDYDILDKEILNKLVSDILRCLKANKKVGVFCIGGHGRTGYVISCVLGKLGIVDPIQELWSKYCKNAIETREQFESICNFLKSPELKKKHKKTFNNPFYSSFMGGWGYGSLTGYGSAYGSAYESAYGGIRDPHDYDGWGDYYKEYLSTKEEQKEDKKDEPVIYSYTEKQKEMMETYDLGDSEVEVLMELYGENWEDHEDQWIDFVEYLA